MIILQLLKTYSDSTSDFKVTLTKEYTVKKFVNEILTNKGDWGYIGIDCKKNIFGDPKCEYRYGKLLNDLPSDVLQEKILSVDANGGYSRMDYLIKLV